MKGLKFAKGINKFLKSIFLNSIEKWDKEAT
jgi:hypothetical protein